MNINVVFSGGPANGKTSIIPDTNQYIFFQTDIDYTLLDPSVPGDSFAQVKTARYIRTGFLDKSNNIIFEFMGIE